MIANVHTAPLKLAVPLPVSAGPEMVKAIDSEMLALPDPSVNVPPTEFPCCASVVVADCAPPTGSFVAPMYSPETASVEAGGKAVEPLEHPTRASPAVAHNAQNLTEKRTISTHLSRSLSEPNSSDCALFRERMRGPMQFISRLGWLHVRFDRRRFLRTLVHA